ncbi:MAG TPA: DUF4012 domain-containing protein, partial [Ktedonobacterales bacterium]|nr:DUF4012 domain-containing protein [Ktedonobacterales bacterium]
MDEMGESDQMTWNEPQAQDTVFSRPFEPSTPESPTPLERAGGQTTVPVPFAWETEPRQVSGDARTQPSEEPSVLQKPTKRGTERRGRLLRLMRTHRILSVTLLACILLLALAGVVGAVQTYDQYSTARAEAVDGIKHLKQVQSLLKPFAKQPAIPDPALLASVKRELTLAEADFADARGILGGWNFSLAGHMPIASDPVSSGVSLIVAADEASLGGLALVNAVETAQPLLHAGFLASETKPATPVLTAAMLSQITDNFETAVGHFDTAIALVQTADLTVIPTSLVNDSTRASLSDLLTQWPTMRGQLQNVQSWLGAAPALLGVTTPQRYLVELLDRGEIRSTGGFIGSYGVLTIQSGQIQPFTLSDVFSLDLPYVHRVGQLPAPSKYAWWPFPGYGLRDSNLSFDFPTSAKYGMQMLKTEGGPDVQGVLAITIPIIQRIIQVIGPVQLPQYGVTVTADNLEPLIRLYTETKAANVGSDLPPSDQLTTLHERFTALLGRAFMAKLHSASTKQLSAIAQILLSSLPTKDLQVYLSNPSAEGLLTARGLDSSLYRGPQDGVTIVDSNTTGNKANLFTTVNYTDAVTIGSDGTATHHLTITYNFNSASLPSMTHYL